MSRQLGRSKNKDDVKKAASSLSFPYNVDYCDHFETPLVAYQDISPLLDIFWKQKDGTSRNSLALYDRERTATGTISR